MHSWIETSLETHYPVVRATGSIIKEEKSTAQEAYTLVSGISLHLHYVAVISCNYINNSFPSFAIICFK